MIDWRESGGPPVAEPSHSGFGSSVIRNMVEYNLNAEVRLDFLPAGLQWRLQCPLAVVVGSKQPAARATPRSGGDGEHSRGPARVLVVEDEALLADEISRILDDAGFQVVGPAGRVEKAFHLLNDVGCDAAVLDMQLDGETSELIARVLAARGTPFVTVIERERRATMVNTKAVNGAAYARIPPRSVAITENYDVQIHRRPY